MWKEITDVMEKLTDNFYWYLEIKQIYVTAFMEPRTWLSFNKITSCQGLKKTPSDGAWAGRTSMSRTLGPPGVRLYKCSWSSLNVDSIFADSLSCWELFVTPKISTSVTFLGHLWTCACKRVTKTMIHPACLFSLQTDVLLTISSAAFLCEMGFSRVLSKNTEVLNNSMILLFQMASRCCAQVHWG